MAELTKNLGIELVHSRTQTRSLMYVKSMAKLLQNKDILLFGSRGRIFDSIFLNFLKTCGNRIIYDAADLPHFQNFYFGTHDIDPKLARKFYSLVKLSRILVIVSKSASILFDHKAIENKKVLIIPNAADPTFFPPTQWKNGFKNILYVGGYAPTRGIEDLVGAFHLLERKHDEIRLKLVGGNMPLQFSSEKVLVDLAKVYSDMPNVYSDSYMCVIPHKRNPYMDAALPVKLFEAMASAKPLVVTDCEEAKFLVEKEKCGVVAKDNPESIAEAMEYLLLHPKVAEEMGNRGREAVLFRHSWRHRAEAIKRNMTKNSLSTSHFFDS
jgi:glycosyltransferase involved in cell wall biosynthesis